jgi:Spy/CpxP family protein refolding chaperone
MVNKMRKLIIIFALIALLVTSLVGMAAAYGFPGNGRWLDADWCPAFFETNLTEDQRGQMRALQDDMYEKMRNLRIARIDTIHELKQLYFASPPDEDAIAAKRAELEQIQAEMQSIREANQKNMHSI